MVLFFFVRLFPVSFVATFYKRIVAFMVRLVKNDFLLRINNIRNNLSAFIYLAVIREAQKTKNLK